MWPYFIPVSIIFFMQFHYTKKLSKYHEDVFLYIAVVLLIIFSGIRGNGDGDYFAYLTWGGKIKTFSDVIYNNGFPMEVGYRFLAWIISLLHLPAQTIIFSMNLISITCICFTVKKWSPNYMLSLLCFLPFFFQFDMHAARTAVAMGISLLTLQFVVERKPVRFLMVVALAAMFHKEAWIIIMLYPLMKVKIDLSVGNIILIFETVFVTFIGVDKLVLALMKLPLLNGFSNKYISYANSEFGYPASLLDPRYLLAYVVFLGAKMIIKKPDKLEKLLINSAYFCVFLMIFFCEHTVFVYRLSSFYHIHSIILVPVIMKHLYWQRDEFRVPGMYMGFIRKQLVCIGIFTLLSCAHAYKMGSQVEYKIFKPIYWSQEQENMK